MTVVSASIGHVVTSLPAANVYELGFSPLGTFIITWQRPSKEENGDASKNLKVWRVLEGESDTTEDEHNVVGRFVQKSQTGWNLQYTYDEQYCARVVTNEVQFYQSEDLGTVWNKLRVEGVTDFAVSPGKNHSVAVFVPERKVNIILIYRAISTNKKNRVSLQLSRSSTSQTSTLLYLRRASSKGTRCSSNGTMKAPVSSFLRKPRLTGRAKATTGKPLYI